MSFWDDITGAFEDLFGYIRDGIEYVIDGISYGIIAIERGLEEAWRFTSEKANQLADAAKELGLTISQGLVDGANIAINWLEQNTTVIIPMFRSEEGRTGLFSNSQMVSRLIGAVFMKYASEGLEYDVFGPLAIAIKEKNGKAINAGAYIAADQIGNDIYNIPRVAGIVVKKLALKDYIAWLICRSATENQQVMADGKVAQVVTGLLTVAITSLISEGKMAAGAPAWPDTKGMQPDPVDPNPPAVWPEGSRISIGGAICMVLDGKVRHISDPETYNNLFDNWDNIIKSESGLQELAQPLTAGAYLSKAPGNDKVYLVNDGVKRWISSPKVFEKYHFNSKVIRMLTAEKQNAIPTGDAIYATVKREGSVLDLKPQGGLYLLLDKEAHHIPNPATFNQLFKNWNRAQEVNSVSVKIGKPITDGAYLATASERVYLVNNGQKRWIMSPIAFNNFNFNWERIRRVSAADLDKLPEGKSIY